MVLLNQVVQVFALPDSDDVFFWFVSVERGQRRRIGGPLGKRKISYAKLVS